MIFLFLLLHPLLSFTFSSFCLFYIPEGSSLILFLLLLLFLCVMCVQSNYIFFFLSDVLLASVGWFSLVICFVILLVHFIVIIRLKNLFTNICNLLIMWTAVFQVSQAYKNTYFTFVLNICVLTLFDVLWFLHTGCSWTNTPFAFLILVATSSPVLSPHLTRIQRIRLQFLYSLIVIFVGIGLKVDSGVRGSAGVHIFFSHRQ